MKGYIKNTNRNFFLWLSVIALFIAFGSIWWLILSTKQEKMMSVSFLDVGQGDAIFIETPNGVQVLIDGGKGRTVLRALGKQMSFFDRTIDMVIATHPDFDHIGGLPAVFSRYDVNEVVYSGVTDEGSDNTAFLSAVDREETKKSIAKRGMRYILDRGAVLEVLFPDRDVSGIEANAGSVVVRLQYGNTSFLLTGDSPAGIESYLVSLYGDALRSTVLKLGHHGSKTSSSLEFLGFVDPEYAVVSASCDNSYGHPHTEVLERLERLDIIKKSTCEEGTVVFQSDGEKVYVR